MSFEKMCFHKRITQKSITFLIGLTMYMLKMKLRSYYHKHTKENEILKYKFNKMCTRFVAENYKMLMKKSKKEILNKWRDLLHSEVGRSNIVKITIFLQLIYRFSLIPINNPVKIFVDRDNLMLSIILKETGPTIAKIIWKRRIKWEESL